MKLSNVHYVFLPPVDTVFVFVLETLLSPFGNFVSKVQTLTLAAIKGTPDQTFGIKRREVVSMGVGSDTIDPTSGSAKFPAVRNSCGEQVT